MWRGSPETRLAVQLSFMHDAPGTPRLECIVLLVGSFRVQGQDLPGSPYVALFFLAGEWAACAHPNPSFQGAAGMCPHSRK